MGQPLKTLLGSDVDELMTSLLNDRGDTPSHASGVVLGIAAVVLRVKLNIVDLELNNKTVSFQTYSYPVTNVLGDGLDFHKDEFSVFFRPGHYDAICSLETIPEFEDKALEMLSARPKLDLHKNTYFQLSNRTISIRDLFDLPKTKHRYLELYQNRITVDVFFRPNANGSGALSPVLPELGELCPKSEPDMRHLIRVENDVFGTYTAMGTEYNALMNALWNLYVRDMKETVCIRCRRKPDGKPAYECGNKIHEDKAHKSRVVLCGLCARMYGSGKEKSIVCPVCTQHMTAVMENLEPGKKEETKKSV